MRVVIGYLEPGDQSGWLADGRSSFGPGGYRGGEQMSRAVALMSLDDPGFYGLTDDEAEADIDNWEKPPWKINRRTFPFSWGAYGDDFGITRTRGRKTPLGRHANVQYPL